MGNQMTLATTYGGTIGDQQHENDDLGMMDPKRGGGSARQKFSVNLNSGQEFSMGTAYNNTKQIPKFN